MIIANPIYDSVFKYLLEDLDIARELLSLIIQEEIVELTFKPQEIASKTATGLRLFRYDFKAAIKTETNELKTILIEIQKTYQDYNLHRFRSYLDQNYERKEQITLADGIQKEELLPIYAIYFLGFNLNEIQTPIAYVTPTLIDSETGLEIKDVQEDFVRLLHHKSCIIQVKRVLGKTKTDLEKVLQIFDGEAIDENGRKIEIDDQNLLENPRLYTKMISRLNRAIADEDVARRIVAEEQVDQDYLAQRAKFQKQLDEANLKVEKVEAELQDAIQEQEKWKENQKQAILKLAQSNFSAQQIADILGLEMGTVMEVLNDNIKK
jgi:hypothetical protein